MKINDLTRNWETFGRDDPLWAILSDPDKKGGRWDVDDFFASGERQVTELLGLLDDLQVGLRRDTALDFGCGVGRLTRGLGGHFTEAVGVDVAVPMIEKARALNAGHSSCRFVVNQRPDLCCFRDGSFDFVLSYIVLQHMRPEMAHAYLAELARVTRRGGVLLLQIPSVPVGLAPAEPLPAEACRTRFRVPEMADPVPAGEVFPVVVGLANRSDCDWLPNVENPLNVGTRWKDTHGRMVRGDDARSAVPLPLPSGQEREVVLLCTAPHEPGDYLMEIDVVQECVRWFSDLGQTPAQIPITVVGCTSAPTEDQRLATMEMHGIPIRDVTLTLHDAGADVREVLPDRSSGAFWRSHFYVAIKS